MMNTLRSLLSLLPPHVRGALATIGLFASITGAQELDGVLQVVGPVVLAALYALGGWLAEHRWLRDTDADGVPDWISERAPELGRLIVQAKAEGWDHHLAEIIDARVVKRSERDEQRLFKARTLSGLVVLLAFAGASACGAPIVVKPRVCVDAECISMKLEFDRRGNAVHAEITEYQLGRVEAVVQVSRGPLRGEAGVSTLGALPGVHAWWCRRLLGAEVCDDVRLDEVVP